MQHAMRPACSMRPAHVAVSMTHYESMHAQDNIVDYTDACNVTDNYTARRSMVPRAFPRLPRNGLVLPNEDPPMVPGGNPATSRCPPQSTRNPLPVGARLHIMMHAAIET